MPVVLLAIIFPVIAAIAVAILAVSSLIKSIFSKKKKPVVIPDNLKNYEEFKNLNNQVVNSLNVEPRSTCEVNHTPAIPERIEENSKRNINLNVNDSNVRSNRSRIVDNDAIKSVEEERQHQSSMRLN